MPYVSNSPNKVSAGEIMVPREAAMINAGGFGSRYQEIMAVTWDPILIVSCATRLVLDANPAACRLYGLTQQELIGSDLGARFSELRYIDDIFSTHRDFVPLRFQRGPSGRHFPVEMSLRYFQADQGECAAIAIRDISNRINRERSDQESERKYQSLFEASPYPILMISAQGVIVDANRCALHYYGYEHDDLAGRDWSALESTVGPASFLSRPSMLPATRHFRKDGSSFIAEVMLSYFRLHGQGMTMALIRDVTDHQRTFQQLKESEARWRFAIEGHGDALIDWPLSQSGHHYVSPMMSRMLGYDETEDASLDARSWNQRVHPDDRSSLESAVQSHFAGMLPMVQAEYRMRAANGEYRWVALRARVIGDFEASEGRLIGAVRDIHEIRQRQQQELVNQEKMFRLERMATIGEMLSALAHEVNQPLTAITNYSSLGIRKLSSHAQQNEVRNSLEVINSQALRAGEIVRRIRDFVRRGEPNYVLTNLNLLVQQVAAWAKGQAESAGIAIQMDLDDSLPEVKLDVLQIEQVVFNLLRNGIEAMEDKKFCQPRNIILRTRKMDEEVEFSVRDFGEGMTPDRAHEIFDPFVSSKPEGMGMGLAIARTVIESHRGRLWAEPVTGDRGTRFAFTLGLPQRKTNPTNPENVDEYID